MKVGMLAIYDRWGIRYPSTVLQLDSCHVIQVKTEETDGYNAVQLGVGEAKSRRVNKVKLGHYKEAGVGPKRMLAEFRVTPDALLEPGMLIQARHFVPGQLVDVCGISKGKGTQGAMKKWNFRGGSATHGNSLSHRVLGSTGQRQDPGRVFKGKKMMGRMGFERVTMQNLYVLKVDLDRQLVYVKGCVPGPNGNFVRIVDAVKGPFHPEPPPFPTYFEPPPSSLSSSSSSVEAITTTSVNEEKKKKKPSQIFAPTPNEDPGALKEPVDPY